MGKSIFEFADITGYVSPWNDWIAEEGTKRKEREDPDNRATSQSVSKSGKDLIASIRQFCKSVKLYSTMGGDFPHWKQEGVGDKKIQDIPVYFGQTEGGHRAQANMDEFGVVEILLNEAYIDSYTVPSFSQALFMEWGNAKNWKQLNKVLYNPKKYSRDEYIRKIEKLEFDVRLEIIKAYQSKQFDSPKYEKQKCVFNTEIVDFEKYYNSPELKSHKEQYGKYWDDENK